MSFVNSSLYGDGGLRERVKSQEGSKAELGLGWLLFTSHNIHAYLFADIQFLFYVLILEFHDEVGNRLFWYVKFLLILSVEKNE